MPLYTKNLTLTGGADQVSSTSVVCTSIVITAPAATIDIGKSDVATVPGITMAGAAQLTFGQSNNVFDLKEMYIKGTNTQIVKIMAIQL